MIVAPNIFRVGGQDNIVYLEDNKAGQVAITVRDFPKRLSILHEGKETLDKNQQALHKIKVITDF